jgi:Endoribonuclease L-PSP
VWPDGTCLDDAAAQTRRCFEIIAEALAEVGASLADVVRSRMFLVDPSDADLVGTVHGQLFAEIRPAATMVIVAGLLDPRWKVEVELGALRVRAVRWIRPAARRCRVTASRPGAVTDSGAGLDPLRTST